MYSRKEDGQTWQIYRILSDHLGSPRLVVRADVDPLNATNFNTFLKYGRQRIIRIEVERLWEHVVKQFRSKK